VALGSAGQIFFAVSGTQPQVIGLNSRHSLLWTPWLEPYGQRIQGIPLVNPDGSRIFFGSDAGIFYCLSTVTGQTPSGWTDFMVPEGVDRRIRSGAAYDAYAPSGPAVYFHGFNGYLYALSATSGALRWRAVTGNGVPPGVPEHPQTEAFASSPVIGAGGTVYVGSTDGYVYAFDAGTGTRLWRVNVGRPIEASLAIGSDGWVFVATRHADDSRTPESDAKAAVLAINPAKAAFNPSQAIEWENTHNTHGVGYLASPVIDQGGFVYTSEFHNEVKRWHPKSGVVLTSWVPGGKICQTPSLNQDGLLILDTSTEGYRAIRAIHTGKSDPSWWSVESVGGVGVGDFLGAPVTRCISSGITYLADTTGRLYRYSSGASSMAGDWPTFQAGVRRQGKLFSYSYLIAELPGFYGHANYPSTVRRVDDFGRASGLGHGYYRYPYGLEWGSSAAVWRNLTIKSPSAPYYATSGTFAASVNAFGDVAGWNGNPSPVVWPDGANLDAPETVLALGTLVSGYAADINVNAARTARTIVGYGWNSSATNVLRWANEGNGWSLYDLGIPGIPALAYAISDTGRIAGKARFGNGGAWQAFVTEMQPFEISVNFALGTLGGLESEAWDVNDESGAVGWAHNAAGRRRAFYIQIGGNNLQPVNELPRLAGTTGTTYHSEAYGVNRLGQVVGKCQNDAGAYRAFLYNPGPGNLLSDLNTIPLDGGTTPAGQGWTLTEAVAINDGGVIVGHGIKGGYAKAWILYPKCVE
jgi:probable HAF family extracellular repeat protein